MNIIIGSDHRGFDVKEKLKKHLSLNNSINLIDVGTFSKDNVDYIDIAINVSEKVISLNESKGILICGSGIGMSIASNKTKGIRAALCMEEKTAKMSREHNDANVLCLSADNVSLNDNLKIVDIWLNTNFLGIDRYKKRNETLNNL